MWTQDLIYLLETINKVAPDVLIDHIDNNGIIYTTNFKQISLRGFLDARCDEKEQFVHCMIITEQNKEDNKINAAWERNANTAKEIYGSYIDYEERFYICPNCEEPVYEEDWSEETMAAFMCPYCEEPLYEEE